MSEERAISTQPPEMDPPDVEPAEEDAPRLRVEQRTVRPEASGGWLPGPPWAWVLGAVAVFALAAVLAFAANGDDGGGATSQAASEQAATADVEEAEEPASDESAVEGDTSTPEVTAPVGGGVETPEEPATEPIVEVEPDLTGFLIPIDGACLTEFEGHLPSSPRAYRNGTHEGWDFYGWASCRPIDGSTAVLAAKAGTIVRIDTEYRDITPPEWEAATDPSVVELPAEEQERLLDLLRGRQVWLDHGDGVVTRYAHLGAVAAGRSVGDEVRQGTVIAFVGESGQLPALEDPGSDLHLHFEIRVGDGYLGEGLPPLEARELYVAAFLAEGTE